MDRYELLAIVIIAVAAIPIAAVGLRSVIAAFRERDNNGDETSSLFKRGKFSQAGDAYRPMNSDLMHPTVRLISAVVLLALGSVVAVSAQPKPDAVYRGRVNDLAPAPGVLGEQWINATGLIIEDISDLESHPVVVRPNVEELKKLFEPIGVRKAADFSFRVPDEPSRYVTLRVFVFDTPESCTQWWAKKYRHDGWEKFYQPVEGKAYEAVDSKETPKRAAAIGNVWMTCHALKDTGDHITIMDSCIEKVLEAIKSD